ncbi:MAG TPA: DNA gyrase inhibitor YacG [Stellaceae bacterium]|nr:DNA gyrase inhibitor YacG [Stellaceae bacterium]
MNARETPETEAPRPRPCPICGKPAQPRHRPFCSPRCAEIDLGRWLKGVYHIPAEEPAEEAAPRGEDEE